MQLSPKLLTLTLATLFALWTVPAAADFETAADAYRRQDYNAAFSAFRPLAEAGDPRAQTVIALMYKFGESVRPDVVEAFGWYMHAAEQGYAPAQYNVGLMLAEGAGVPRDREAAINWLQQAADNGYSRANDELAQLAPGVRAAPTDSDELKEWSQAWDLRLPNRFRYANTDAPLGRYKVQVGAMRSRVAAERLWSDLVAGNPALFEGLEPVFDHTEGAKTMVRVQATPFPSAAAAKAFCTNLGTAARAGCMPLKAAETRARNSDG